MSLAVLLATIVLAPVLDEPGWVRLVATGVGDEPVRWLADGAVVATTRDGEASRVWLGAGEHRIEAQSAAPGGWQALARPDPGEATWNAVPAWYGEHAATQAAPGLPLAAALAVFSVGAARAKRT